MVTHFSPKNGKFNGIFTYINQHSSSSFSDYIDCHSSWPIQEECQTYQDIFPPTGSNRVVHYAQNGAYTFTFKTFSINVTSYSLKGSSEKNRYLSDWTLEASNSGSNWEKIDEVSNCDDCYLHPESNRKLSHQIYNSFRLTKLNGNQEGNVVSYFFGLYGFEIFGTICNPVSCDVVNDLFCTAGHKLKILPSIHLFIYLFVVK